MFKWWFLLSCCVNDWFVLNEVFVLGKVILGVFVIIMKIRLWFNIKGVGGFLIVEIYYIFIVWYEIICFFVDFFIMINDICKCI